MLVTNKKSGETETISVLDDLEIPHLEEFFIKFAIACHRDTQIWKSFRDYSVLGKRR